uniref:ATP synthase complex subunit 8 n=1 Tax=Herpele squalostoma TaxID=118254 RepID=K7N8E7_HERSQ|nr:ATP synthase F0 subunit 8 [Herpele squalostoma]ADR03273.1 ATP synthase F0 subunit 8 [Herpele squalostoma]
MPQLNPSPWLMIMLSSWLILLTAMFTKIISHKPTNDIHTEHHKKHSTPWTWPW